MSHAPLHMKCPKHHACMAQHALVELYGTRKICHSFSSTLDSWTTVTRQTSRLVGGGGTSSTNEEDSATMVGRGEAWDLVVLWETQGWEKLRVSGRWVSSSTPIGVSGLRFCEPKTSAPSRWGLQVQNSSRLRSRGEHSTEQRGH